MMLIDMTYIDYQIVCAKVREGDQRIVRIKEGDPAGSHVVIVDDLVQSGGTLTECQVRKLGWHLDMNCVIFEVQLKKRFLKVEVMFGHVFHLKKCGCFCDGIFVT